jgi:hypothetical protein
LALKRLAAVWVVLSFVVIAAALSAYALDERNTAAFVRSLVLPGSQPDTMTFDAASTGALSDAVVTLGVGAAVAFFGGRPLFAIAAIWSVLAIGTGTWIALGSEPRLASVQIGPIELSMVLVGVGLALAAGLCLAGSIAGWLASPSEPGPLRPHMPYAWPWPLRLW